MKKKSKRQLESEEIVKFKEELSNGNYGVHAHTKNYQMYRCLFCRTSTVRHNLDTNLYYFIKCHLGSCKIWKNKKNYSKEYILEPDDYFKDYTDDKMELEKYSDLFNFMIDTLSEDFGSKLSINEFSSIKNFYKNVIHGKFLQESIIKLQKNQRNNDKEMTRHNYRKFMEKDLSTKVKLLLQKISFLIYLSLLLQFLQTF